MLAEALLYLLTPASWDARRLGHLTAAISLWSRARRCRTAWAPHYARCHAAIAQAIEGLPQRRTVLVLGSGLGEDVDLPRLRGAFERVVLVDIVHPLAIQLAALADRRLSCVSLDLSGANDFVLGREPGLVDRLAPWRADPAVDLVISANVLSQLPLLPIERLERRSGRRGADPSPLYTPAALGRAIVDLHLEAIRAFRCRVCLLTDTTFETRWPDGRAIDRVDLLHGATLPDAELAWDWTVAPLGEAEKDHAYTHRAVAYPDFHAAFGSFR